MGKIHRAAHCAAVDGGKARVRLFLRLVQDGKNALARGDARLNLGQNGGDGVKGFGKHVDIHDKRGDAAHRQPSVQGKNTAQHPHQRVGQVVHKPGGGVDQRRKELRLEPGLIQPAVNFTKRLFRQVLPVIQRHQPAAGDLLLCKAAQLAHIRRLRLEALLAVGGQKPRHIVGHNGGGNRGDGHIHVRHGHQDNGADDGDDAGEQLCQRQADAVTQLLHIRHEAADHIAVGRAVEKAQRQPAQFGKHIVSQALAHAVGHSGGGVGQHPLEQVAQHIHADKQQCVEQQAGQVAQPDALHGVHSKADNPRARQRACHIHSGGQHAQAD